MARRPTEHAERSDADIPPPPLRLRIHRAAPPHDGHYRELVERLEIVGRFRRLALDLPGVAGAAAYAESAAADLGVKPVRVGPVTVSRVAWHGLVAWFWVSRATSTVYLLHAIPESLFGRIPASADHTAAVRGAEVQRLDAARAAAGTPADTSNSAARQTPPPPTGTDQPEPRGKPARRGPRRGRDEGSQGDGS